jgi:hypothetical protein
MRQLTLNVLLVFDYLRMTENSWAADSRNWNKLPSFSGADPGASPKPARFSHYRGYYMQTAIHVPD